MKSSAPNSTFVELVPSNAKGWPMGMANPAARWSDSTVAEARRLHAEGMPTKRIARHLAVPCWTVRRWLDGSRRQPPARVVARLRRPTETDPPSVEPQATTGLPDDSEIA